MNSSEILSGFCAAIFIFNLLDLATTALGLNLGLTEANTTLANAAFAEFIAVKILYAAGICGAFLWLRRFRFQDAEFILVLGLLVILASYFGLTVVSNALLILSR